MEILHVQHWQMYLQTSQENHHTNPWEYFQAQSDNNNIENQKNRFCSHDEGKCWQRGHSKSYTGGFNIGNPVLTSGKCSKGQVLKKHVAAVVDRVNNQVSFVTLYHSRFRAAKGRKLQQDNHCNNWAIIISILKRTLKLSSMYCICPFKKCDKEVWVKSHPKYSKNEVMVEICGSSEMWLGDFTLTFQYLFIDVISTDIGVQVAFCYMNESLKL